jgi:hypothetical protein
MLSSKGLSGFLCIPLTTMPKAGQILLAEGTLPYGMEYPDSKLAILSEGQLLSKTAPKRKAAKKNATKDKVHNLSTCMLSFWAVLRHTLRTCTGFNVWT